MGLDFRNCNALWASVLVETWVRLGLRTAVVCPGSRSTPLTVAIARQPQVDAIPVLDERSAAFFALGVAKRSHCPVVLICTSGTAGANFYPAVIEASESRVPLIVLTADRPPELRDCASGQTVDQQKLYGRFPNWYAELALPALTLDSLRYARQMAVQAWQRSQFPLGGPVHLNCPFRDPLAPLADPETEAFADGFDSIRFFAHLGPPAAALRVEPSLNIDQTLLEQWQTCDRGLIIAGPAQPLRPQAYCQAVAQIAQTLGWPILAEGLSPLRNQARLNPQLITAYDAILRQPPWAERLVPEQVIQLGPLPTSKVLRQWLQRHEPLCWQAEAGDRNLDPLHQRTRTLPMSVEQLAQALAHPPSLLHAYWKDWAECDRQVWQRLATELRAIEPLFEGKVTWMLSRHLPEQTPLIIANSMPVRDVEYFWQPGDRQIQPFFNRGANGIDGTLSTALGVAHQSCPSVLLTGDLALLHDTNGFLSLPQFQGHLTIVMINNNGGGIFEMLPISQFEPPFEQFFAMPQQVNWQQLSAAYGITYERVTTWERLQQAISTLPATGIRLLEISGDRKRDTLWRQQLLDGGGLDPNFSGSRPPQ